ncbi:prephenate dehydrogenase [Promicromonospora sp. NPDC057488]|uniref:prephenate dehydrogenase n=1 Tax=Promicromonospora sp. NPDC057488 TaxID=3346147 RepID=UPI00367095A3
MTDGTKTAGVVGLGFMGASLGAALRTASGIGRVVGYDSSAVARAQARADGHVDEVLDSAADVARAADLLVLCTPVQQIITYLTELGPLLRPGTIVMDIGSTKSAVTEAMDKLLPDDVVPIGGHPMTGPATAGADSPTARIYDGRVFLLTPTLRTDPAVTRWCTGLLQEIGARVEVLEPERHDRLVAVVSHLPRILPLPLLELADKDPDPMLAELPAGGFRESTRKATENLDMWADVLVTNTDHVVETLRRYAREVELVADRVAEGDPAALRELLTTASDRWTTLFETGGAPPEEQPHAH